MKTVPSSFNEPNKLLKTNTRILLTQYHNIKRFKLTLVSSFLSSLHDRKMCVLGLCALIDLDQRPVAVNQVAGQLLPAAILLFTGLKRAYACRAEHENEDEDDEDGEDDEETGKNTFILLE